ncbi:hypothetical protein D7X48_16315 [bacterium D16-50]|nr:hypothetical protein D7X48_16315 [bacterium D16-50]
METLFEILKVILPAVITSLFTFFITKYTYNNNRPLDKIEIAYNRIYYPIYKIISDKNITNDINEIIKRCKLYFTKYEKYADISTKKLFEELCGCNKETKKKSIYQSFKDNIYNRNYYLRRRLGYLEPSFIQLYKYAISGTKSLFRITMGLCLLYATLVLCGITMNISNMIFTSSAVIFTVSLVWIICELLWCFFRFLYYKIRK